MRDYVSFTPYVERDDFRVYKPHGSIEWVQLLANEPEPLARSDEDRIIEEGEHFDLLDDGFRFGRDPQFRVHENPRDAKSTRLALPALALPLTEKSEFACPEVHIEALRSDLGAVTRVLVIGWRASEQHFLNLWKEALAASSPAASLTATVVSGSGFAVVQRNLERCGMNVRAAEQSTFREFIIAGLEHFLYDS